MNGLNGHRREVPVHCLSHVGRVVYTEGGIPAYMTWVCNDRKCRETHCHTDDRSYAVVHAWTLHGEENGCPEGTYVSECVHKRGLGELLVALREH